MKAKLCCLVNGYVRHTNCGYRACGKHWAQFLRYLKKATTKKKLTAETLPSFCPKCGAINVFQY